MKKLILDAGSVKYGGGSYTYLYEFIKYLNNKNDYLIVYILNSTVKERLKIGNNSRTYFIPNSFSIARYILQTLICAYERNKDKKNITFVLSSFTFLSKKFYLLAQSSLPFHDQFVETFSQKVKLKIKKMLQLMSIKKATKCIAVSNDLANAINQAYNFSDKVVVIPHVVPQIEGVKGKLLPQTSDYVILLYVGSISKLKGSDILLKTVLDLIRVGIKIKLHLVGSVSNNFNIEFSALLHEVSLCPDILFYGHQDYEMINSFYQKADIFIQPSLVESFSLTPLEALSHGLEIIVSDIAVHNEILGSSASYFKSGSRESLKSEILHTIEKMKSQNLKDGPYSLNWDGAFNKTLNVLEGSIKNE